MNSKYKHILTFFKKSDPKIYSVMKTVNFDEWLEDEVKPMKEHDYFLRLCREIVGQQLSGKAAHAIYTRFTGLFGKGPITPDRILALTDQNLRDSGISWAKVRYVKDLAGKVKNKEIHLEKITKLSDEEVTKELIKVKGIGNWTTEMFLIFVLGRQNVFSFGDLGLKKGIAKVYKIKDPSEKQISRIIKRWQPYKTYGSISLWHSLDNR